MSQVSRPLLAVLVAAIAFLGIWLVALKPSSSNSSGPAPAQTSTFASGVLSAVGKAKNAVATSNAASAAHGGTIVTTPSATTPSAPKPDPASTPTTSTPSTAAHSATTPSAATALQRQAQAQATAPPHTPTAHRLNVVSAALNAKKVLALLFYNPAAADDRAVKRELAAIPLDGGRVVDLAVPLRELARYPVVTAQVPVTTSPTLVLINAQHQATTILGFADSFEIAQRITDALSA